MRGEALVVLLLLLAVVVVVEAAVSPPAAGGGGGGGGGDVGTRSRLLEGMSKVLVGEEVLRPLCSRSRPCSAEVERWSERDGGGGASQEVVEAGDEEASPKISSAGSVIVRAKMLLKCETDVV